MSFLLNPYQFDEGGGGFSLADFSQLNVGDDRYITEDPGVYIRIGDTNTDTTALQLHGIYQAAPSSPFRVVIPVHYNGTYSTYNLYLFGFRKSSTGALRVLANNGTADSWEYQQWSSATNRTLASMIGGSGSDDPFSGTGYLGLSKDGIGDLFWEWSADGVTGWTTVRSDGADASFDELFVGVMPYSTGLSFSLDVYGWTPGSYP